MSNNLLDLGTKIAKSDTTKTLVSKAYKYMKDVIGKERMVQEYLEVVIGKNATSKNIFYNKVPVNLYQFYVDLDVSAKGEIYKCISFDDINDIGTSIIISGNAGSGKTTLMRHLLLDSVRENSERIPFFMELRSINDLKNIKSFEDFMITIVKNQKLDISVDIFKNLLINEETIIFLDGYDEVHHEKRKWVYKELSKFMDKYPVQIVMTSRPNNFVSWDKFVELDMEPLTKEKATSIIRKLNDEINQVELDRFISEMEKNVFIKNEFLLSNPLLLTILLITYNQSCEIPSESHLFYENAYNELYQKHDANKGWFKRKHYFNASKKDFTSVLEALSFITYLEGQYHFKNEETVITYIRDAFKLSGVKAGSAKNYLKDLVENCSLMMYDGDQISFIHKSFQEYFAAKYINVDDEIRNDILEHLELPEDEKVIGFLFEMDMKMMVTEYSSGMLNDLSNKVRFDIVSNNEVFANYLRMNHKELVLGNEFMSTTYSKGSFACYLETFYENYRRMFPRELKSITNLHKECDYDNHNNRIDKIVELYNEIEQVNYGTMRELEETDLGVIIGDVTRLDIDIISQDKRIMELVQELLHVDYNLVIGLLNMNSRMFDYVGKKENTKKALLKKYLNTPN